MVHRVLLKFDWASSTDRGGWLASRFSRRQFLPRLIVSFASSSEMTPLGAYEVMGAIPTDQLIKLDGHIDVQKLAYGA